MKRGKLALDGGVLAGVDALGGSDAVGVDDHEDAGEVEECEVDDGVEEVVSFDLEPQSKGKSHGGYLCENC